MSSIVSILALFLDTENIVEIVFMLRSELEVKLLQIGTFHIYIAAILNKCHTYNFYFIMIGFLDHENMRVNTKIVILSGLQLKISPKTQFNDCCMPILFLASNKCPQRCQADMVIRLLPTQEVSKTMNQS